jgi:hypothetical protein
MPKPLPRPPAHSRWEILKEIDPTLKKRQAERTFRVRCVCGSGIEKELAYRYVIGESLSCGCLVRETAAEIGRSRLSVLNAGYQEWLETNPKGQSRYGPKLPSLEKLIEMREQGMSCAAIGRIYDASGQSVSKRLKAINLDQEEENSDS